MSAALWVMGDIHGEHDRFCALLRRGGLLDEHDRWLGADACLVCLGDYVDRGRQGVRVIERLMSLEQQARQSGGQLLSLLGNHEVMLLAARRFGESWRDAKGRTFLERWRHNGGQTRDLLNLTPALLAWLVGRPAAVRVGSYLFMHADSRLLLRHGSDLDSVNSAFSHLLASSDPLVWDALIREFAERDAFRGPEGASVVGELLASYGGERLVHGHTPIAYVLDVPPPAVQSPLLYADGRGLNVDGGLAYHPRAGFLVRLGPLGIEQIVSFAAEPGELLPA
ncbi:metallophosphoesterase [Deinococcus peraridilitoris]|uniref:Calcineurin-like phosphoesterase n=1 Tax=Deinococcus peraridilitoris (strain DSM 19664 / LMG 22246 / CIP 109416 / KR-200) TaxID=937777 RepID=K9ZXU8_DEIPD|nr:metallophosphoesterase [Deinococcus peraridilitoris]AFZ66019.1 Calcineurin-like phosphoesterase [Deinococcus peraridilitoris DSM 19664]